MMNNFDEEFNGALEEAQQEDELVKKDKPIVLPEEITLKGDTELKVQKFVSGELDTVGDLPTVTKHVAQRLNIGLMNENIKLLLGLQRQKKKIEGLEALIYSENGVNADKDLVALYKYENDAYLSRVEYVRKYILNNKSAMDELTGDTNELVQVLTQLSKDQINKLKEFISQLTSESSINNDDILE